MIWLLVTALCVVIGVVGVLLAEDRPARIFVGSAVVVIWLLTTSFFSFTVIDPGYQGVVITLGDVDSETLPSGVNFKNPASDIESYLVKRQLVDMRGGDVATSEGVRAVTSDKTTVWVDIAFPYTLNGEYTWWVHEHLGGVNRYRKELLIPAARAATKNAAAEFTWEEVAITDKESFVKRVRDEFLESVREDLSSSKLSSEEAEKIFDFHPVQLRNVKLPEKLENSVNERMAAKEDLKRQETLKEIAKKEAERRQSVGRGIATMIEELPDDYDPDEMTQVIHAIADIRRSKATVMAIERDQVSWGLFTGGNETNPGVNVQQNK